MARLNRRSMNEAEVRLLGELRRRQIGYRFRFQFPIGPDLVDFACVALRLIVEIEAPSTKTTSPTPPGTSTFSHADGRFSDSGVGKR